MKTLAVVILAAVAGVILLSLLLSIKQLGNPCGGCRGDCSNCPYNQTKNNKNPK